MTTSTKKPRSKRLGLKREETASHPENGPVLVRGVIYARYSHGSSQTDQSLEGQLRECRHYAQEHGIEIVEEYLDPHISGKDAENRPAFQRMIADSDKQQFEVVIVWKTDRFARNRYDSAHYKERLKRNGVTVRYAAEHIPDTAEGIILESLLEGMAEYYSAELKQKVLRGMRESAYKCKALTRPPFGYQLDEDKHYVIDPATAPYVRQMFQMYIAGEKLSTIANQMNAIGLQTTKKHPFTMSAVRRMVGNEKYTGVYEYKAGGIRRENAFPAIIEKSVFLAAQARSIAQQNGTYSTRNYGGAAKRIYLLSGIVYCGECGSTMFGETTTRKKATGEKVEHGYYACKRRRTHGRSQCDTKSVPKDLLEGVVKRAVAQLIFNPPVLDGLCEAVVAVDLNKDLSIRLKSLKQRKKEKESAVRHILEVLERGGYSEKVLKHLNGLEEEVQNIDLEIEKCHTYSMDLRERIQWLLRAYPMREGADEHYWNEIIHCFVKSVTCFKNGTVVIRFNLYHAPSYDGPVLELGAKDRLDHCILNSDDSSKGDRDIWETRLCSHQIGTLPELYDSESYVREVSFLNENRLFFGEKSLIVKTMIPQWQGRN